MLAEDLSKILEPDEVHMIKRLLDVRLAVKCEDELSDFFETDTGVPQGDGFSANQFTFYLANALKENPSDHTYTQVTPHVKIDMQYADDLTHINSEEERHNQITQKLKPRNLTIKKLKSMKSDTKDLKNGKTVSCLDRKLTPIKIL